MEDSTNNTEILGREAFRQQARETLARLSETGELPTIPGAASAALAVAREPLPDVDKLCCVIETDVGLAARVLRIANSAAIGRRVPTKTLHDALVAVGLQNTCNILLSASARGVYTAAGPRLGELWNHSLMVALSAKELAHALKLPDSNTAFLPGLFHDVGCIVLLLADPTGFEIVEDLVNRGRGEKIGLEREWYGFDHATAGGVLTQDWGLAPDQCDAISHHHEPATEKGSWNLATIIAAADAMACAFGFGDPMDCPAAVGAANLGLSPETEAVCAQQARTAFKQHKALLS